MIKNNNSTSKTSITVNGGEVMIDYVTSDLHVGHTNIAKFTGRPFDNEQSTFHMDETLISNWNEVVEPGANVLHLGDAALGKLERSIPAYGRMNGTILIVPGNHDGVSSVFSSVRRERNRSLYESYFTILDETIGITIDGVKSVASHYPYVNDMPDRADKFAKLRPKDEGLPLLHGHTHSHDTLSSIDSREFHVGIDAHNLRPIHISVIENWVQKFR